MGKKRGKSPLRGEVNRTNSQEGLHASEPAKRPSKSSSKPTGKPTSKPTAPKTAAPAPKMTATQGGFLSRVSQGSVASKPTAKPTAPKTAAPAPKNDCHTRRLP